MRQGVGLSHVLLDALIDVQVERGYLRQGVYQAIGSRIVIARQGNVGEGQPLSTLGKVLELAIQHLDAHVDGISQIGRTIHISVDMVLQEMLHVITIRDKGCHGIVGRSPDRKRLVTVQQSIEVLFLDDLAELTIVGVCLQRLHHTHCGSIAIINAIMVIPVVVLASTQHQDAECHRSNMFHIILFHIFLFVLERMSTQRNAYSLSR